MQSGTIKQVGTKVIVINRDLNTGIELHWTKADELARKTRLFVQQACDNKERIDANLTVEWNEGFINWIWHGRLFMQMSATIQLAVKMANAVTQQARQAELYEKDVVEKMVLDGTILTKFDSPFGITNNKDIQKEIANEAAFGKGRKLGQIGIPTRGVVGTPTLQQKEPTNGNKENAGSDEENES